MTTMKRCCTQGTLLISFFVSLPARAEAFEVSGGVGLGGLLAGTAPRFAVSPHLALSWTLSNGFLFGAHEMVNILLPLNGSAPGFYEQTSGVVGYAGETWNGSLGPSLSVFYMSACGPAYCGRVLGLAPGGHAQVNRYLYGRFGVAVNASVDWVGGASHVLPGGVAATLVAGPVLRWMQE